MLHWSLLLPCGAAAANGGQPSSLKLISCKITPSAQQHCRRWRGAAFDEGFSSRRWRGAAFDEGKTAMSTSTRGTTHNEGLCRVWHCAAIDEGKTAIQGRSRIVDVVNKALHTTKAYLREIVLRLDFDLCSRSVLWGFDLCPRIFGRKYWFRSFLEFCRAFR